MACSEHRQPRKETEEGAVKPEAWYDLLPDLLWPAVFVLLVLLVIGTAR